MESLLTASLAATYLGGAVSQTDFDTRVDRYAELVMITTACSPYTQRHESHIVRGVISYSDVPEPIREVFDHAKELGQGIDNLSVEQCQSRLDGLADKMGFPLQSR